MSLKLYSNVELLEELKNREDEQVAYLPPLPALTPYDIMCNMIKNEWHEDIRVGKSNPNIDNMWAYLGLPHFTDDQSYCAATVNTCLKLCGYKTSDVVSVARSFEDYGESVHVSHVQEGDIVVFKRKSSTWKGHVGFVKEIVVNKILVAGGNQNNKMCFKHYLIDSPVMKVTSFRRILKDDKIGEIDYTTLKNWKLI